MSPDARRRAACLGLRLCAGACLCLALDGCLYCLAGKFLCRSSPRPQPVQRVGAPPRTQAATPTGEGLRLPVPQPYLLVQGKADGEGVAVQVVYLPDPTREIVLEPRGRRATFQVSLDQAGFLREVSGRFKARRDDSAGHAPADGTVPLAPFAEAALQIGDLARSGGLAPGLYRILTAAEGGGEAPRLERVRLDPSSSGEALRVDNILFHACPGRPEVVQRIEVTADRGTLPALTALAAEARVLRDGKPADGVIPAVGQRGIAFTVDADCQHGFHPYALQLPASGLAPGSQLGAAFPSEKELSSLRPRAKVHLVKDDRGAPRYLMLELDPGTGSPIPHLEKLTRASGLLLVNGRAAGTAQIARELSSENLYAVDLGEPEVRSIFLLLTPRNAANLAGRPVAFSWTATEPPPPRREKPPPLSVRETSLETVGGKHNLTLALDAPSGRMDIARTVAENQRRQWQGVRCAASGSLKITCSGAIAATRGIDFRIYCTGEEAPCLTVDFSG